MNKDPRPGHHYTCDNKRFIIQEINLRGIVLVEEENNEDWEIGEPDSFLGEPFEITREEFHQKYLKESYG